MMGHRSKQFKIFALTTLESLVPSDSFYRLLDSKLDLSFVRTLVRDRYEEAGRPSIDPVVFFKLQLVLFFEGLRSERELVRTAADRLSVRWYLGYDFDEPLPDHSSLTRIRQRLGLPTFDRFFERVVELCQEAGLVWGKELFIDATKVRANADVDSLSPRFYQQAKQHLEELFAEHEAATQMETAVPADVHERLQLVFPCAGHHDGDQPGGRREERARFGELPRVPHVLPGAAEDPLLLETQDLRVRVPVERQRRAAGERIAELGVDVNGHGPKSSPSQKGRRGGGDGRGNAPVRRIPAQVPAGAESPPQGSSGRSFRSRPRWRLR